MAALNKAAFEAKYGTSGTNFPTNTTGDITAATVREFGQDIADSLYNVSVSGALTFAVINIGDWNMDTSIGVNVSLSGIDSSKIRSVSVLIRPDGDQDQNHYDLCIAGNGGVVTGGYIIGVDGIMGVVDAGKIYLSRVNSSIFDDAAFNQTSFNRGWITVSYVA
jgi:hypothetical protein